MTKPKVQTGLEALLEDNCKQLAGAKVALLSNQASITSSFTHVVDALHSRSNVNLTKLFGPEHGIRGTAQDMVDVADDIDPSTNLPVISLYAGTLESLHVKKDLLHDVDTLVVDLPDIGTRYYTYAQTLAYAMKSASETNTKIVVLDRPNPINGSDVEGSLLVESCRSFCGLAPVPQRHGLTLGELALLMNKGVSILGESIEPIHCELEIVKMKGWQRDMFFEDTGLPWVLPSPNMPTVDTAIVYPGACLFEATEVSEGRGTTRPFEFLGAPGIDAGQWIKACTRELSSLSGVSLRPTSFEPRFQKYSGKICSGVQIHISDRIHFKPFRLGLALILSLAKTYPERFAWRTKAYEFEEDVPAIDLLYGNNSFRKLVDTKGALNEILDDLEKFETEFVQIRRDFLLY